MDISLTDRLRCLLHNRRNTSTYRLGHWRYWRRPPVSHDTWPSSGHDLLLQGCCSQQGWTWATFTDHHISHAWEL